MIKCIAVDDEPLALKQIQSYISHIPNFELVATCKSAGEALQVLNSKPVDVMFIDINMPDLNGMEFVKSLNTPPTVVFTTAYSDYAVDAYKVGALDYLLKPFDLDDFARTAAKIKEHYDLIQASQVSDADEDNAIFFKTEYKVVRVDMNSIVYVEAMSEYLRIHTDDREKPSRCPAQHEEDGGAPALVDVHARSPLAHRQPEENQGSKPQPHHPGRNHLPPHR